MKELRKTMIAADKVITILQDNFGSNKIPANFVERLSFMVALVGSEITTHIGKDENACQMIVDKVSEYLQCGIKSYCAGKLTATNVSDMLKNYRWET
jgi:hypothetical protein